jgi:hypothetical protein
MATPAVASLALLALAAPASAGPAKLKLEAGGVGLVGGAPVTASSANTTVSSSFWSVACSEGTLQGSVSQNHKSKGDAFVITNGSFGGGGEEGLCASTPEFVTIFQPGQTPELTLAHNGKALLRFPRLRLVPRANIEKPEAQQQACVVSATSLRGTFPVSETPQPLEVTFTGSKMHLGPNQGPECGAGMEARPNLSGTFTFTSRESAIEAVLYHRG